MLVGANYKEYTKLVESFEVLTRITSTYTDPAIIGQQKHLDYLYMTLLRLYNPTGIGSQEELKLRVQSLMSSFQSTKS